MTDDPHVAEAIALQAQRRRENTERLEQQIAESRRRTGRDLTWDEYMRLPLPEAEEYFNAMAKRNREEEA